MPVYLCILEVPLRASDSCISENTHVHSRYGRFTSSRKLFEAYQTACRPSKLPAQAKAGAFLTCPNSLGTADLPCARSFLQLNTGSLLLDTGSTPYQALNGRCKICYVCTTMLLTPMCTHCPWSQRLVVTRVLALAWVWRASVDASAHSHGTCQAPRCSCAKLLTQGYVINSYMLYFATQGHERAGDVTAAMDGNASCAASMAERATFVSLRLSAHADVIQEQRQGVLLLRQRSCHSDLDRCGWRCIGPVTSSHGQLWRAARRVGQQGCDHSVKDNRLKVRARCAARCWWIAACELNSVWESALWGGNASCAASIAEQATFVSPRLSAHADMIHEQRLGVALLRRRSCSLKSGALWLEVHLSSQIFTWMAWASRAPGRPAGILSQHEGH